MRGEPPIVAEYLKEAWQALKDLPAGSKTFAPTERAYKKTTKTGTADLTDVQIAVFEILRNYWRLAAHHSRRFLGIHPIGFGVSFAPDSFGARRVFSQKCFLLAA